ncbi:MAG: ankyrin repeat domain-containing protein [Gammaproteobacteria bacterium]|nr:ankyrin repeat domain-containing protein [Gammaproteobacteria bacterium]
MNSRELICQHVFNLAKQAILVGSNWGPETKFGENTFWDGIGFIYKPKDKTPEEIEFDHALFRSKSLRDHVRRDFDSGLFEIENEILHLVKHNSGNCEEFATFMLYYCALNNIPAEKFSLELDHCAIVMWRNPESNPNDSATWSESKENSAWICDPWMGDFFPVSSALEKYRAYFHVSEDIITKLKINNDYFNREFKVNLRTIDTLKKHFTPLFVDVVQDLKKAQKVLIADDKKLDQLSLPFKNYFQQIHSTIDFFENNIDDIFKSCLDKAKEDIISEDKAIENKAIKENKKSIETETDFKKIPANSIKLETFSDKDDITSDKNFDKNAITPDKKMVELPKRALDEFSVTRKYLLSTLDKMNDLLNYMPAFFQLKRMVSLMEVKSESSKKELFSSILKQMESIYESYSATRKISITSIRTLFKNVLWIALQQEKTSSFTVLNRDHQPASSLVILNLIKEHQLDELLKIIDIELNPRHACYQDFVKYLTGCAEKQLFHPKFLSDCKQLHDVNYNFFNLDESKIRTAYRLNTYAVDQFPAEIMGHFSEFLNQIVMKKDMESLFRILSAQSVEVRSKCFSGLLISISRSEQEEGLQRMIHFIKEEKDDTHYRDFAYSQIFYALLDIQALKDPKAFQLLATTADKIIPYHPSIAPFTQLLPVRELYFAARGGKVDEVQQYIDLNINVNYRYLHEPALFMAISENKVKCVELLLKAGADVNMQSPIVKDGVVEYKGYTPLHLAIDQENYDCAILLIKAKADVTIKDANGSSPLDCIEEIRDSNIKSLLKKEISEVSQTSSMTKSF